jgi:hypothetical protein
MTDAQRDSVYAAFEANRDMDEAVVAIIGNCAIRNEWSDAATQQAVLHTIGAALRRALLREPLLTPAQIRTAEDTFNALFTDAQARAMLENGMNEQDGLAMERAFAAAGLPQDEATMGWLGSYMAASQMEKYSRIAFAELR